MNPLDTLPAEPRRIEDDDLRTLSELGQVRWGPWTCDAPDALNTRVVI
jgi:hypothetical protein